MELVILVLIWLGCGFLCEYLGNLKGQKGCFLYGFLLGIIGIIIVLCLKDKSQSNSQKTNVNKYEQLERLQQLKEAGTITEMEFEIEKSKVLR